MSSFENDKVDVLKLQTDRPSNNFFNAQNDIYYTNLLSNPVVNHTLKTDEQKNLSISALDSPDLVIHFFITRKNNMLDSPILIKIEFSNKSFTDTISSLNFKMAVPKVNYFFFIDNNLFYLDNIA